MEHADGTSPQTYARIGGILYLIVIVAGVFADGVLSGNIVVPNDAGATARNIMASESLWRIGFAGEMVLLACATALALIFYVLLRPVNSNVALLAAFFNLVSIAIEGASDLCNVAPLVLLRRSSYMKVFDPHQLQALALLSLRLRDYGFGISLVIFACFCLTIGYLIYQSGYFPKTLGVFMAIAGLCYLTNSFALFLNPALEARIFPGIVLPAGLAELALCLWLLVVGVNVQKWQEKTNGRVLPRPA